MYKVVVYDIFNNKHEWTVETIEKGREYAKRIIMEGLWEKQGEEEVFYPVHQIIKVKVCMIEHLPTGSQENLRKLIDRTS